jgi:hypothetical protein
VISGFLHRLYWALAISQRYYGDGVLSAVPCPATMLMDLS